MEILRAGVARPAGKSLCRTKNPGQTALLPSQISPVSTRLYFRRLLALLALPAAVRAEVTLAPLFTDHAVLQCDKPVPVWGRADAGEKVTVTFHGQAISATTGADGRWIVYLEKLAASAEPAELVVTGRNTVTVRDVLVGEVWLASGQSNMEWPVNKARDAAQEMAAANFPLIRHVRIEHTVATAPADTVKTSGWQPASPATVGGFTAVGYFFARDLHRKLGVPVGIIHSSWGGTAIESWMSDASRRSTSLAALLDARWKKDVAAWTPERIARYPADMTAWLKADASAKAAHKKNRLPWPKPPATTDSPSLPGGLFNGMIAPLQPGALRGILWYQGESNAEHPEEYAELFTTMIRAWRANWSQGDPSTNSGQALPFYFVQIPNYGPDEEARGRNWAQLREAQTKALVLPNTGMAVTIDVGDAEILHPINKQEVGRRLALIAKTKVYGIPGDCSGPEFSGAVREGAALRVKFTHADGGLISHDKPVQSLEIAGEDKVFHAATAKLQRDTLLVSAPAVREPVAVRYAWINAPVANLYNGAGLPAAPFRSDNW